MKIPSLIVGVLALAGLCFASLGGSTSNIAALRFNGTLQSKLAGNSWTYLGTFTVPDKPVNDGTWEQFHVSYGLQWSAVGEVRNDGAPLAASPGPQASTLGIYFHDPRTGLYAMPGHFVCASPMTWPALDTGAEHSKALGSGQFAHEFSFESWQFPYCGWTGVSPGQVLDVWAFSFPAWDEWPGWQNDPGGEHFYSVTWNLGHDMAFEWQQQEQ